jgi:hypothetical protein
MDRDNFTTTLYVWLNFFITTFIPLKLLVLANGIIGVLTRLFTGKPRNFGLIPGRRNILPLQSIQTGSGANSAAYSWPKHEADHVLPPSAEVKNAWSYISVPPYSFRCAQGHLYFYYFSLANRSCCMQWS